MPLSDEVKAIFEPLVQALTTIIDSVMARSESSEVSFVWLWSEPVSEHPSDYIVCQRLS